MQFLYRRCYSSLTRERVCIIGSGNWGSAVGKIIGQNVLKYPTVFETQVKQWVFEESYQEKPLTSFINQHHENPKYLPGIRLPTNLKAIPNLTEAAKDASVLVFCLPHQFVHSVCQQLKGSIPPSTKAISLIKGLDIQPEGITLFSAEIARQLSIPHVATLSGANIANQVAQEEFSETTIGCPNPQEAQLFHQLFHSDYFRVHVVQDHVGVELCGALKNIVAIGAGISDGLGYGDNTKAAIIRLGLLEMRKFGQLFFNVDNETFFESCGIADLITTCFGGRNRKLAEAFVKTGKSIQVLEKEWLNGQKLQGTLTAQEVHAFLCARNMTDEFPLFSRIYEIIYENAPAKSLLDQSTIKSL